MDAVAANVMADETIDAAALQQAVTVVPQQQQAVDGDNAQAELAAMRQMMANMQNRLDASDALAAAAAAGQQAAQPIQAEDGAARTPPNKAETALWKSEPVQRQTPLRNGYKPLDYMPKDAVALFGKVTEVLEGEGSFMLAAEITQSTYNVQNLKFEFFRPRCAPFVAGADMDLPGASTSLTIMGEVMDKLLRYRCHKTCLHRSW
jgi:hypothetical protein